ncbi:NADH--cytochrome b5 reductase 1 [Linum perenne]
MQKFMIIPSGFDMKNVLSIPHADLLPVFVTLLSVSIALAWRYYTRKPKGCLDPEKFQEFKLVKKTAVSPNVARFRFALPSAKSVLGLPTGYHLVCRGQDSEGKEVTRKYTPVTLDSDVGYFELVIKMYPHGRMSHHFRKMQEGDYLAVKGPTGRFGYKPGQVRAFGMIAGGSGITPMFQVTRAILENPKDKTNLSLIYANTTFQDILLKEELDGFAAKFPSRFKVYYVLSQPPTEGWNGGRGRVTKDMIQSYCPPPASDIQVSLFQINFFNRTQILLQLDMLIKLAGSKVWATWHEQGNGCSSQ